MQQTNEELRLQALYSYNILDSGNQEFFDRITSMTAQVFDMPIALIGLVDRERMWFKSAFGLSVEQISREDAFCSGTIPPGEIFELCDATQHPTSRNSQLVAGKLGVQYCAAAPLVDPKGFTLGMLCVLDRQPNSLTEPKKQILAELAKTTVDEILLWHTCRQLASESAKRRELQTQVAERDRLQSLGILVAGVAHDLNNLLVPIAANAQVLQRQSGEAEMAHVAAEVYSAAVRSAELCSRLLIFGGDGRAVQHVHPTATILRAAANAFRRAHPAVQLQLELADELPNVAIDTTQIRQVFANLFRNAVEAQHGGDFRIQLTAQAEHLSDEDITQLDLPNDADAGDYVRICVADNGCGISEQAQQRMLDAFYTTKPSGTGVGLAFVAQLLKNHQAPLRIKSVADQGTEVHFWLPVSSEPATSPSRRRRARVVGDGRVLLVDDDELVRQSTTRLLQCFGYEVLTASDGQTAMDLFMTHQDSLSFAIIDLLMPNIDGRQLIKQIREVSTSVPLIVATGNPSDPRAEEAQQLGASECLRKPYSISALQAAVESATQRHADDDDDDQGAKH